MTNFDSYKLQHASHISNRGCIPRKIFASEQDIYQSGLIPKQTNTETSLYIHGRYGNSLDSPVKLILCY